ncbi:uncharacterized protein [Dermacentor albipictus]|uniref:uncharacterized protein n=1 Tax=Dermacentor albipictus TaxID=60249 RepID=UPI0031FBAFC1
MLNFVFCFVQVFLWLPGSAHDCSLPPADYTSRPCTESPTALCLHNHVWSTDASVFPPKAPPQEDNCAGLPKLDISFCARPRRITSSDGHKKTDRPAAPFSGLGGTVRHTMLNFVFCFVQVFLWLPGSAHDCSLPPADYTSRPCTESPTALCLHNHVWSTDASVFPPKAPPQEDNCAGLPKLDISFCARPRRITSSDGQKKTDRPAAPFSGLGSTVRHTMLNFVFCFVQVFLWLPGSAHDCSLPPADYTSRPCTESPTALCLHNHVWSTDASVFPPKAPPQEDNCAGLPKLDISFCARPRRITSSDGHKKTDRPAAPFSGLGGTVRHTMLNFVFCFVQVWHCPCNSWKAERESNALKQRRVQRILAAATELHHIRIYVLCSRQNPHASLLSSARSSGTCLRAASAGVVAARSVCNYERRPTVSHLVAALLCLSRTGEGQDWCSAFARWTPHDAGGHLYREGSGSFIPNAFLYATLMSIDCVLIL